MFNTTENSMDSVTNVTNSTVAPEEGMSAIEEGSGMLAYRVGVYIHLVWLPIVVVVGSVGNILSFSVMVQVKRLNICYIILLFSYYNC